jgi:uncharacterized SAM-binding protein YcdF (DUF218 family)
MKILRKGGWKVALATVAVLGLLGFAGLLFSSYLLCVDTGPATADCIVVLGGETPMRAAHAAQLYQAGSAPKILVSGSGDCRLGRKVLLAAGIPESVIQTECESTDTMQNARFTMKVLKAQSASHVIIVTSWFHSRRALACFRKAAPDVVFHSCPILSANPKRLWPDRYERKVVLREYVKIGWYWVRHGVAPI